MLKIITVVAIILTLIAPVFAAERPVFTVGKLTPNMAPDAISNVFPGISSFTTPEGDQNPTQPTDVHISYDDANLYVLVRCFGDMSKLTAKPAPHDSKIYGDDCVEVFLDPRHDRKTYYHLIVNAAGAIYDEKDKPNEPKSWDGDWTAEVNEDTYYWSAFITIPFKMLGIRAPKDGAVWGMNFVRNAPGHMERGTWAHTGSSFHSPDRFGEIVFAGTAGAVAELERPTITSPGKHDLTMHLVAGTRAFSGQMEITLDGKPIRKSEVSETPNVEQRGEYKITIPTEGRHGLCVTITNKATKRVMMRTPVLLDIPAHMARLERYRKLVKALPTPTPAASREKSAVLWSLNSIAAFAKTAVGDDERWAQLGAKLDAIERKVNHVRDLCTDKLGI